jgi:hypothetical protein
MRSLPRPLVIPDVMTLSTLADVRTLMRHLPAGHGRRLCRSTWRCRSNRIDYRTR